MPADINAKTFEAAILPAFNAGLFDRMRVINRSWLARLREIHQVESEFGERLLAAGSRTEAASICQDWMAKRLEMVGDEQKSFTSAWLELVADLMDGRRPAGAGADVDGPPREAGPQRTTG